MNPERDDDGWLEMDAFPDTEPSDPDADREPELYVDPPPLSDGDWLAAVSAAVAVPQDAGAPVPEAEDAVAGDRDDAAGSPHGEGDWSVDPVEDPAPGTVPQLEPGDADDGPV